MGTAPRRPRVTTRLARTFGMDGNPLRRASDRAEAWIRAGLLIVFLIAGPMAALAAGRWTAHVGDARNAAQSHAVHAVLLRTATAPAGPAAAVRGAEVWVSARWEKRAAQPGPARCPLRRAPGRHGRDHMAGRLRAGHRAAATGRVRRRGRGGGRRNHADRRGVRAVHGATADSAVPELAAPGRLGGGLAGGRTAVDGAPVMTRSSVTA